jgi:glutamate--cysteine ligase
MSEFSTPGYEDMELSTQILIAEALSRGARVEVLDRGDNFILIEKGSRREFVKQATRTSADNYASILVMENKEVAKRVLAAAGIRVPTGFLVSTREAALRTARRFAGKPLVVKPRSTNFGDGVAILGPDRNPGETAAAVDTALALDSAIILEDFVPGREFRFLVIGGKTRAVLHRVPANVLGDGVSTIRQLVEKKNAHPYRGEGYRYPLEKIRLGEAEIACLEEEGLTPDSRAERGGKVLLRKNSNISTGGDSIDYSDAMPEIYKHIAERAAEACGARISGIDMIIPDIGDDSEEAAYSVIELNYNPALHIHDFPAEGENRRVERHVLDLLGIGEREKGEIR